MKIKNQKDFWAGVMFMTVGLLFAWGATNYSFGSSARPGPAYFPFGLGLLLGALGLLEIIKAVTIDAADGGKIGPWPLKQAVLILFAVVLFGLTLPKLGLVLALPILIGVGSLASGEFRIKEVLVNCTVLTVFSWFIFIKGLGLTIPLLPAFLSK